MISEIAGAVGATKSITDLLSKATQIAGKKKDKELLSVITEIQSQFIDLREEVESIKKKLDISDRIIRHSDGLYVTLKDDPDNIRYCSTCWGKDGNLVQIGNRLCHVCHTQLLGYEDNIEDIKRERNSGFSIL